MINNCKTFLHISLLFTLTLLSHVVYGVSDPISSSIVRVSSDFDNIDTGKKQTVNGHGLIVKLRDQQNVNHFFVLTASHLTQGNSAANNLQVSFNEQSLNSNLKVNLVKNIKAIRFTNNDIDLDLIEIEDPHLSQYFELESNTKICLNNIKTTNSIFPISFFLYIPNLNKVEETLKVPSAGSMWRWHPLSLFTLDGMNRVVTASRQSVDNSEVYLDTLLKHGYSGSPIFIMADNNEKLCLFGITKGIHKYFYRTFAATSNAILKHIQDALSNSNKVNSETQWTLENGETVRIFKNKEGLTVKETSLVYSPSGGGESADSGGGSETGDSGHGSETADSGVSKTQSHNSKSIFRTGLTVKENDSQNKVVLLFQKDDESLYANASSYQWLIKKAEWDNYTSVSTADLNAPKTFEIIESRLEQTIRKMNDLIDFTRNIFASFLHSDHYTEYLLNLSMLGKDQKADQIISNVITKEDSFWKNLICGVNINRKENLIRLNFLIDIDFGFTNPNVIVEKNYLDLILTSDFKVKKASLRMSNKEDLELNWKNANQISGIDLVPFVFTLSNDNQIKLKNAKPWITEIKDIVVDVKGLLGLDLTTFGMIVDPNQSSNELMNTNDIWKGPLNSELQYGSNTFTQFTSFGNTFLKAAHITVKSYSDKWEWTLPCIQLDNER